MESSHNQDLGQLKTEQESDDFDFEGKREDTTFFIHMMAGSVAGLMEHVALYPIDTIKVKIIFNKNDLYFKLEF